MVSAEICSTISIILLVFNNTLTDYNNKQSAHISTYRREQIKSPAFQNVDNHKM